MWDFYLDASYVRQVFLKHRLELRDLRPLFWATLRDIEKAAEQEEFAFLRAHFADWAKVLGAPGDFGYGTPCGEALRTLYQSWNKLLKASAMGATTNIQWTDHTFNPWIGCAKVAPGCVNCYAEADMDKRRHFALWGQAGTRVKTSDSNWRKPIKWNREAEAAGVRRRVFCASLCDVFEDWTGPIQNHERQHLYVSDQEPGRYPAVPFAGLESLAECERENIANGVYRPATMNDLRRDLFRLIDSTEWLDWQLLTKRPENVKDMWPARSDFEYIPEAGSLNDFSEWNRDNVWIGTSVSDQKTADENIPKLLECAQLAPVLFVSAEPLLEPIDLRCLQHQGLYEVNALTGANGVNRPLQGTGPAIKWVIVGGESGPNARPCRPEWIRAIKDQCEVSGVPCFVKQMGANVVTRNDMIEDGFNSSRTGWPDPEVEHDIHGFREDYQGADCRIRLRDKKGGDWSEWPESLRVREFPRVTVNQ